jgi:hypothetical protein
VSHLVLARVAELADALDIDARSPQAGQGSDKAYGDRKEKEGKHIQHQKDFSEGEGKSVCFPFHAPT